MARIQMLPRVPKTNIARGVHLQAFAHYLSALLAEKQRVQSQLKEGSLHVGRVPWNLQEVVEAV